MTAGLGAPFADSPTVVAAAPVFSDPPTRVYTAPGVDLPFTGSDPITTQARDIVVSVQGDDSTCVVENPGDEGLSGNCVYAQIQILEPSRGAMTIDDSSIAYTSATRSGDNTFNIGGQKADIQAALASLVYVPPDDEFETTDDTPVTLRVVVQAPQPTPDTASIDVDIRVEGDNAPPELTAPADDPYEVAVNQVFSIAESAGTEVFTVTDEDAEQDDNVPPDYLLGVAWLDCGTMTFVSQANNQNLAYEGTVEDLFADVLEVDWDPAVIAGEIGENLTLGTGWTDVTAVAWVASIDTDNESADDNFNNVMSAIDFAAPGAPATCTLTILVSDLGNNGMPLVGEIPPFAFDFDSVVFNVVDDPDATDPPGETVPPTDTADETVPLTETTDETVPPTETTDETVPPTETTDETVPPTETTDERVPPTETTECVGATAPCPTDPPVDTPPDTPVETPPDTPVDTPVETPPDTPVDTPVETPVDTPVDTPPDSTTTTTTTTTTAPFDCATTTTTSTSTTSTSTTSTLPTTFPEPSAPTTAAPSSTALTTTTVDPCAPPPECATTTTAATTIVVTTPATNPVTSPTTAATTPATTTTEVATTTTGATTTTTEPVRTTTVTVPPTRPTTPTTIVVGIPTTTTGRITPPGFAGGGRSRSVDVAQVDPCLPATTVPSGGLPPTQLTGGGELPATGSDSSAILVLAAILALAGGAIVMVRRRS